MIAALYVGFGVAIPALVISNNRQAPAGGGPAAGGGGAARKGGPSAVLKPRTPGPAAQGKQIFTQSCGTCHILADAGTSGQIGPSLDQLKPDVQRVLKAIKRGGLGSGTMPANLVTGKDAKAVATYVASVAGK